MSLPEIIVFALIGISTLAVPYVFRKYRRSFDGQPRIVSWIYFLVLLVVFAIVEVLVISMDEMKILIARMIGDEAESAPETVLTFSNLVSEVGVFYLVIVVPLLVYHLVKVCED